MNVTVTGSMGGPAVFNGLAGPGALVTYGDDTDKCRKVALQFDAGRGTVQRLSQLEMPPARLNAIFLTHLHSDHVDGLADLLQVRWHFNSKGPKVDLVCTEDAKTPAGHTVSCAGFAQHIGDPLLYSGEIAQRRVENPERLEGGPAALINPVIFKPSDTPQTVWQSGDVTVRALGSSHMPGHASFRIDTPAGSVVIAGDAGNDTVKPPRATSTSAQVEALSQGADVIVHSVIHPVMGPEGGSKFPPPIFWRQSTATDLGAMAQRAGVRNLVMTHMIPPIGAVRQGPFTVPNGPLTAADYEEAAKAGGFTGNVVAAADLFTLRLPKQ